MKYGFCFFLLLLILSCKKDTLGNAILATWELRQSYSWDTSIRYVPGNGNLIAFDDKSQYIRTTVSVDTTYSLSYIYKLIKTGRCNENLILTSKEDGREEKETVKISGDTLYLSTPSCYADGGTSVFVKQF